MSIKVLSSLLLFAALTTTIICLPEASDDTKQKVGGMLKECKTLAGAGDADVAAIKAHNVPPTHAGLCMLECVFDKAGIMKDGKYNKNNALQVLLPLLKGDAAKAKNLTQMVTVCEGVVGEGSKDKCETAKMVAECSVKNSKELMLMNQ